MKKICACLLTAGMIAAAVPAMAFSDVPENGGVVSSSIYELYELEVVRGYGDDTFRPDSSVTRGEMAQLVANLLPIGNNPGVSVLEFRGSDIYTDLDENYWGNAAVSRVSTLGYFDGYDDGSFRSEEPVTYQEAIKVIVSILHYDNKAEENGAYPGGYLTTAEELGLTQNIDVKPEEPMPRGDIAVLISNALDIPRQVVSSYTIGGQAVYEPDENLTLRKLLESASAPNPDILAPTVPK